MKASIKVITFSLLVAICSCDSILYNHADPEAVMSNEYIIKAFLGMPVTIANVTECYLVEPNNSTILNCTSQKVNENDLWILDYSQATKKPTVGESYYFECKGSFSVKTDKEIKIINESTILPIYSQTNDPLFHEEIKFSVGLKLFETSQTCSLTTLEGKDLTPKVECTFGEEKANNGDSIAVLKNTDGIEPGNKYTFILIDGFHKYQKNITIAKGKAELTFEVTEIIYCQTVNIKATSSVKLDSPECTTQGVTFGIETVVDAEDKNKLTFKLTKTETFPSSSEMKISCKDKKYDDVSGNKLEVKQPTTKDQCKNSENENGFFITNGLILLSFIILFL